MKRNTKKDLPIFIKYSNLFLDFFQEHFEKKFDYKIDDHFAFMILCFLTIQKEHLHSTLTLVDAKLYSDATIISRKMIEGVGIILWVTEDLQRRALQWRTFSVITDYRIELKRIKNDKSKIDKEILKRSLTEGKYFLKDKYKKSNIQMNNLPIDPFKKTWLLNELGKKVEVYKYFGEDNKVLYEIYGSMSDWVHWNVNRIGSRITRAKNEVEIQSSSTDDGCFALSSAILSLHYFYCVVDKHLQLNLEGNINNLMNSFKDEL